MDSPLLTPTPGAVIDRDWRGRRTWRAWLDHPLAVRAVAGGVIGAELSALIPRPWSYPLGVCVVAPILLPLCLLVSLTIALLHDQGARRLSVPARRRLGEACVVGSLGLCLLAGGVLLSNHWLIDGLLGTANLLGDGAALVLSVGAALGLHRGLLRRPGLRRRLGALAPVLFPAALLLQGVGLGIADTLLFPQTYPGFHVALILCRVVLLCAAVALWPRPGELRTALLWVAAPLMGLMLCVWGGVINGHDRLYARIVRQRPSHRRILGLVRARLDGDGDGFSPWLGGGDCDDHDASVYPLAWPGRDCLGWLPGARPAPPRAAGAGGDPAAATTVPAPRPQVLVLVTIDAFRCGFGAGGPALLRDACPRLAALGAEGLLRPDARSPNPRTMPAFAILHAGRLRLRPAGGPGGPPRTGVYLAARLRALGYRTQAIATHAHLLADPGVQRSFDAVDTSLMPAALRPRAVTSEATTDLALRYLRDAEGPGRPFFLWVHYYDPHAPYVTTPGSPLTIDRMGGYANEIRRTDAAIGRLAAAIRGGPLGERALLVVTSDHGDAFGEHGESGHGTSLYEEMVRIPILAWAPGADHRRFTSGRAQDLPRGLEEVSGYLLAAAGGAPYAPAAETFLFIDLPHDLQFGLVRDGWKLIRHFTLGFDELFDLRADPEEATDLAESEPERLHDLGRQLGAAYLRTLH